MIFPGSVVNIEVLAAQIATRRVCGSGAVAKSSYLAELVSTSSILLLRYLIPIKQNKYIHKRKKGMLSPRDNKFDLNLSLESFGVRL